MRLVLMDEKFLEEVARRFVGVVPEISSGQRDVIFVPREFALRRRLEITSADKQGQFNQLDFISIWREVTEFSWKRQNTYIGMKGVSIVKDSKGSLSKRLVPVDIEYSVVYWTRSFRNVNLYIESFLFWIHSDPDLKFVSDSFDIPHEMDIRFLGSPSVKYHDWFTEGRYYEVSSRVLLEGWVDRDVPVPLVYSIYANCECPSCLPLNIEVHAEIEEED